MMLRSLGHMALLSQARRWSAGLVPICSLPSPSSPSASGFSSSAFSSSAFSSSSSAVKFDHGFVSARSLLQGTLFSTASFKANLLLNERRRHFSPPKSHHPTEAETSGLAQIFPAIWSSLEADYGRENLVFPKEIIWLMGSPGAGKGTHSQFLQLARGFSAHTIVSSDLLNSPDAQRAKANGGLIDDAVVIEAVLRHLLRPEYQNGVIVDGYPRTPVQVEGIKLLRDKMYNLRQEFASASDRHFRPRFRVVVLYISEEESIKRQLTRGEKSLKHNEKVIKTGLGDLLPTRPTDFDPAFARDRYQIFKEHFTTLESLRNHFVFTLIDASGSIETVRQSILKELEYQSSQELSLKAFDALINIPVCREVQRYARQLLITRLDNYVLHQPVLFSSIVQFIEQKVIPVVRLHSFAGRVIFKTSSTLLLNREAIAMLTDVLTERGYRVYTTYSDIHIPESLNKDTFQIVNRIERVWDIHIDFPPIRLRGGHDPNII